MDFSKLGKARKSSEPNTLVELFDQLDRKASHNSLRPVQIEALNGLLREVWHRSHRILDTPVPSGHPCSREGFPQNADNRIARRSSPDLVVVHDDLSLDSGESKEMWSLPEKTLIVR